MSKIQFRKTLSAPGLLRVVRGCFDRIMKRKKSNTHEMVKLLLAAGAEVDVRDTDGLTPLHTAAAFSDTPAVRLLLAADAEVNARTKDGLTPLHLAARFSKTPAVVELLIGVHAKLDARTKDGLTPLHLAARFSKSPAVVEVLLDAGASPKVKDRFGKIPWDYVNENSALEGTNTSWRLDEGRFQ